MDRDRQVRNAKRKELRELLRPYAKPSYGKGLALVAFDLFLYGVLSATVVISGSVIWKFAAGVGLAIVISRLFVLGHDAGHNSLTPSRRLNAIVARLVFLPTYSCLSLWEAGHNVAHHGFPGLRGRDVPWVPLAPDQYLELSRWGRLVYRVYRSWWGSGIYYGVDIWWKRLIFPSGKIRRIFLLDSLLVSTFFVIQIGCYLFAAWATGESAAVLLAFGIVLPFLIWLYLAAIVFYVHHTDIDARWYDNQADWRAAQPDLAGTRGTQLPFRIDSLLHRALEHTAHHVNPVIPSYRLAAAQRALEMKYPSEVQVHKMSFRRYVAITRQCQLYDFRRNMWLTAAEVEAAPVVEGVR